MVDAAATPDGRQADENPPPTEIGSSEIDARTDFLIERLEARQKRSKLWYRSWFAVYAGGVVIESTRAALSDDSGARAEHIVGATKAGIGVAQLLLIPMRARYGADPILALPADTEVERTRRLEAAENLLESNARGAEERRKWQSHVFNVALNLVGGAVLIGLDEPTRAAISTGLGIAFGELFIWTEPSGPAKDWQEYREKFDDERDWSLSVTPASIALEYRF